MVLFLFQPSSNIWELLYIIHSLSDPDISFKIGRASAAFGALRKTVFSNKLVNSKEKGKIYVAICLTILLYGIES